MKVHISQGPDYSGYSYLGKKKLFIYITYRDI